MADQLHELRRLYEWAKTGTTPDEATALSADLSPAQLWAGIISGMESAVAAEVTVIQEANPPLTNDGEGQVDELPEKPLPVIDDLIIIEDSTDGRKKKVRAVDLISQPALQAIPGTLNFVVDGGGVVLTPGEKGMVAIPFDCTITGVTMIADQTGSVVVDIWKDTFANYPPTDADSITAAAPPTITSDVKMQDTTLTGWTKTLSAGDFLCFNIDSVDAVTRLTIALSFTRP